MCQKIEEKMSEEELNRQRKLYFTLSNECERVFLTFYTEIARHYVEYLNTGSSYRKFKVFQMSTGSDCMSVVNELREEFEQKGLRKDFALLAFNEARSNAMLSVIKDMKAHFLQY